MKRNHLSVLAFVAVMILFLSACHGAHKGHNSAALADSLSTEDTAVEQTSAINKEKIIGTWKTKSPILGGEGANITITFEEEDVTLNMDVRKSIGGIGSGSTSVAVPGTYYLNDNNEIVWEFFLEEAEMGKLSASFTEDAKDEIYFTPGTEGSYRARLSNKIMEEVTKVVNTCTDISPLPLVRTTAKKLIFELDGREFIFSRVE